MDYASTPLVTDADLLVELGSDFAVAADVVGRVAAGLDGTLSGWDLSASGVDFGAAGVSAGMVATLLPSGSVAGPGRGQAKLELLAIDAVSGGTLTLRRPNLDPGVGFPPAAGSYQVGLLSVLAKIRARSADLRRRYRIDDDAELETAGDLAEACRFELCEQLCRGASKEAGSSRDNFAVKADEYRKRLAIVTARLDQRYGALGGGPQVPSVFTLDGAAGDYPATFGDFTS